MHILLKVMKRSLGSQNNFFPSLSNYFSPSIDKRKYVRGWVLLALPVLLPQVIMNLRDTHSHTRIINSSAGAGGRGGGGREQA